MTDENKVELLTAEREAFEAWLDSEDHKDIPMGMRRLWCCWQTAGRAVTAPAGQEPVAWMYFPKNGDEPFATITKPAPDDAYYTHRPLTYAAAPPSPYTKKSKPTLR